MNQKFIQYILLSLKIKQNNKESILAKSKLPAKNKSTQTTPESEKPTAEVDSRAVMKALETAQPVDNSTKSSDSILTSRRNDPAISGTLGYITQRALNQAIANGLDISHIKAMLSHKANRKGKEGVRRSKYGFELIVFTPQGPCQFIGKLKNGIIAFDTFVAHTEYVYS